MRLISSLLVAGILTVSTAVVAKPLYMFITHASVGAASSVFWQAVKNGMEDACELYEADCQMVYLQSEDGNIGEEIANFISFFLTKGVLHSIPKSEFKVSVLKRPTFGS